MRSFLKFFLNLFLLLAIIYICLISADNGKIVWNPKEWYYETAYLIKLKPAAFPTQVPIPSKEVADLVDPSLQLAFYIIQQDPQFNYLAQFAINNKIPIKIKEDVQCDSDIKACYVDDCPINKPGVIYLNSSLATAPTVPWTTAGIMIHELTHAWNHLEDPSYYCTEEKHLSDEYSAFKNQELFKRQYTKFGFFDYFDRQGNLNEYCLHRNTKAGYEQLGGGQIDDLKFPSPGPISAIFCYFYSDLTTF